jgi:NADH dehydrogenase
VYLDTQVKSANGGHVVLSTGEEFDSELIVWTAGNAANPVVGMRTDLPVDERGFLVTRPDLRVGTDTEPAPDAWAAGDDAGIEDLTSPTPGTRTGAQFPTRRPAGQAARPQHRRDLARRKAEELPAPQPRRYCGARHRSRHLPVPATRDQGPLAWLMHRGYHLLAVPSWERKVRVLVIWLTAALFGRDIVSLASVQHPRDAFTNGGEPAVPTEQDPS